jgi:serine/threonine protein phosphatase PrpC
MQKYKFSVDSTFQIGSYHVNSVSPCQDYAQTHLSPEADQAFLVISDGCSSGGQTDVGARILVHRYLVQAKDGKTNNVNLSNKDLKYLGLEIEDFLATLVTIEANQEITNVAVAGDGVIVLKRNDGTLYIYQIEWANNAPAYPVYFSDAGKHVQMPERFVEFHKEVAEPLCTKYLYLKPEGVLEGASTKALDEYRLASPIVTTQVPTGYPITMIAIFSDGIDQIRHTETGERLSLIEAVKSCLNFKNTTGSFVKRRIRKQMSEWKKQGYEPFDDLSCAVLLIEEVETDDVVEEVTDGN